MEPQPVAPRIVSSDSVNGEGSGHNSALAGKVRRLRRRARKLLPASPVLPHASDQVHEVAPDVDVRAFHAEVLPGLLKGEYGELAHAAAEGLGPLVLTVGGSSWTYRIANDAILVEEGALKHPWVAVTMDPHTWSDVATRYRTFMPLHLSKQMTITTGNMERLGHWEVVLRALYFGIPGYDPRRNLLLEADGSPIDLGRVFSLADDDAEMQGWLQTTGFLHLKGVLTKDEVEEFTQEVERLSQDAVPDDPTTWWATRPDGSRILHRIIYVSRRSPLLARLPNDPRLTRLAALLGSPTKAYLDRQRGLQLLIKPAGELVGISNLPWHHDCWYEADPITCPSITIGIQVTGSNAQTGRFEVIPGSQGQSVSPVLSPGEIDDWPRVGIDTEPGDVTVHLHDVLHASPAPTGTGGRATVYMTYYPLVMGDHVEPGEEIAGLVIRRRTLSA